MIIIPVHLCTPLDENEKVLIPIPVVSPGLFDGDSKRTFFSHPKNVAVQEFDDPAIEEDNGSAAEIVLCVHTAFDDNKIQNEKTEYYSFIWTGVHKKTVFYLKQ